MAHTRESGNKLQRKAFIAAVTRSQVKGVPTTQASFKDATTDKPHTNPTVGPGKTPADSMKSLVKARRFSSLHTIVSVVAWVQQAAKKWLEVKEKGREQVKGKLTMLTVGGQEDALRHLFLEAHARKTFPFTILNRLVATKMKTLGGWSVEAEFRCLLKTNLQYQQDHMEHVSHVDSTRGPQCKP